MVDLGLQRRSWAATSRSLSPGRVGFGRRLGVEAIDIIALRKIALIWTFFCGLRLMEVELGWEKKIKKIIIVSR